MSLEVHKRGAPFLVPHPGPSRWVVVFVRWPQPGQTKTRLARTIGDEQAAHLARLLAEDLLRRLRRELSDEFRLVAYTTPADRWRELAAWLAPQADVLLPQPAGDLAERLQYAVNAAFFRGRAREVFLVGTDCPDLEANLIAQASAELSRHDAVIGPARDGGYYLLGLRQAEDDFFAGINYSAPTTARETVEKLEARRRRVAFLPRLADIDEADDLAHVSRGARQRLATLGFAIESPATPPPLSYRDRFAAILGAAEPA